MEVLSADAKCIINALNTQYPEYWYELLHVTGKSIRGSNENGNMDGDSEASEASVRVLVYTQEDRGHDPHCLETQVYMF